MFVLLAKGHSVYKEQYCLTSQNSLSTFPNLTITVLPTCICRQGQILFQLDSFQRILTTSKFTNPLIILAQKPQKCKNLKHVMCCHLLSTSYWQGPAILDEYTASVVFTLPQYGVKVIRLPSCLEGHWKLKILSQPIQLHHSSTGQTMCQNVKS